MRFPMLVLLLMTFVGADFASAQFATLSAKPVKQLTQEIDLSHTIEEYAQAKGVSISQARLDTCLFLGLASNVAGIQQGAVTFKKVSTDVVRITASEAYFDRLPAMLRSLELGKKQVVVHLHTLTISPQESKRVHQLLTPDSIKVHYDRIPEAMAIATEDTDSLDDLEPYVSTSTVIHQNVPVTIGLLTQENFEKLTHYVEKSPTASMRCALNVAGLPGETSTLSNLSSRPFVVGTSATEAHGKKMHSPTIQALEDGTSIRVKAIPNKGRIQLMTDIAISRLADVEQFQAPGPASMQIQMPAQQLRQVHMATMVDPGTTILIDPNFVQATPSAKGRKRSPRKTKFLVALRAEIVEMDKAEPSLARNESRENQ